MSSLFKKSKAIRTIFFDVGGVVVDAPMTGYLKLGSELFGCEESVLARATALALPALERAEISSEEFWTAVSSAVAEAGGQSVPAWKFRGFWEGLLSSELQIDQELIDLVRRLKAQQVRVAVLSNVIKEHAVLLQKQGVYEHFNPVILSCEVKLRKPDKQAFLHASKLTKTEPARCLVVDDCQENIAVATSLGFQVFHYTGLDEFRLELFNRGFLEYA